MGVPNISRAIRDAARPWRLPGLPSALLVVPVGGETPRIIDGGLNPDASGLEYLRGRATASASLPT